MESPVTSRRANGTSPVWNVRIPVIPLSGRIVSDPPDIRENDRLKNSLSILFRKELDNRSLHFYISDYSKERKVETASAVSTARLTERSPCCRLSGGRTRPV